MVGPPFSFLLLMISQLREFFKLKNLLSNSLIPLLAFLILGYIQRNIYDWTQLRNRGYERAIEIGGYLLVYVTLSALTAPFRWIRPQLKVTLYKDGSSKAKPETSEVFDLADRERIADVIIELEFTPSMLTRKCMERMNKGELGIRLTWSPRNLLSCSSRREGDKGFSEILDNALHLYPFDRMDLEEESNFLEYSFRFALGTTEVVQRVNLRPRHLNWKSRLLFGLNSDTEFLFEIKDSRPKTLKAAATPNPLPLPVDSPTSQAVLPHSPERSTPLSTSTPKEETDN